MQDAKSDSRYQLPPAEVIELVDAKPDQTAFLSPDNRWLIVLEQSPHPSIQYLARPVKKLAGIRFDPSTRSVFSTDFYTNLRVRALESDEEISVPLPQPNRITRVSWSQRSDAVALSLEAEHGEELWWFSVADPENPQRLVDSIVENIGGFNWCSDGRRLICHLRADDYRPLPMEPGFPSGPIVEESSGVEAPARTYQDLLNNDYEAELFECFVTSQLAIVDPESKQLSPIGSPGMYFKVSQSPNGEYYLIRRMKRPFSFTLPHSFFPMETVVWDKSGNTVYQVDDHGILDSIPIEGVPKGPRRIHWKSGKPAQLIWVEALDEGDPRRTVEHRDRLMEIQAPFVGDANELLRIQYRYDGRISFADPELLLLFEYDRERRWIKATLHNLCDTTLVARVLIDRSVNDLYNSPGSVLTHRDEAGIDVAKQFGNSIFLSGKGATPEGLLPFLDLWDLSTWTKKRLWRCEAGYYEYVLDVMGSEEELKIITSRESKHEPPNCWLLNHSSTTKKQLTHFPDPTPQVRKFRKELLRYRRDDGTELSATLYLPPSYRDGERLPLLIWAYPQEYNDAQTAGQVTTSPNRFTNLSGCSHLMLLTQGYAVLNNATMPIVGDPATMNDTF
ncbi:MAG: Prolyl tripeptidyl peptidase precursor, partial [Planctomycetota bacterium]